MFYIQHIKNHNMIKLLYYILWVSSADNANYKYYT